MQFARRHQVPILHDFAYAAIGSGGQRCAAEPLLPARRAKAWGVETYTFSKTFNMALAGASASRGRQRLDYPGV
ncbi:aminotransferase class I/II-fold pyridoxal phosphate-dependent enzyme [Klebsiella pneumoniae subsp. pneumoniae]|nr:aminotransferase class I/II-fold pyridoxal phosphate-dependent enzyme [Klebsiella pneumoniae subsp. pneumoniae]